MTTIEKTKDDILDERALEIALQPETLTGDIRDTLLSYMKNPKTKPWERYSEREQKTIIENVTLLAQSVISRTMEIYAGAGRRTIEASLKKVAIADTIKGEIEIWKLDPQRRDFIDATGGTVLIVLNDASIYQGERAPVVAAKDQPPLFDKETGEIKEPAPAPAPASTPQPNGQDQQQTATA